MKAGLISRLHSRIVVIAAVITLINPAWVDHILAATTGSHHSFLGGPWELVVKMGFEGEGLRFPLTVSDENKPYELDTILPVMGTPINIKLEKYIPDLKWETVALKHPGGGIAAKLLIEGKNLKQDIWLCSGDPARQSISSDIGGIVIRMLHDPNTTETLAKELIHPKAVGILSVWPEDSNRPFECVAKLEEEVTVPGSRYKITVKEYLPHYSIDLETKKVINLSEKPVNPAVKIILNDGQRTSEQWLWSKFMSSPHEEAKIPLRMRFTDIDLHGVKGKYILIVARRTEPRLLLSRKGKKRIEKAKLGRSYPFENRDYSFNIQEIMEDAIIKMEWKNNTERLLNPAVIVTIEQNGTSQQTVLELNKPFHYKTKYGTLVLFYRRKSASSEIAYVK